jgi:hypothetical protein
LRKVGGSLDEGAWSRCAAPAAGGLAATNRGVQKPAVLS